MFYAIIQFMNDKEQNIQTYDKNAQAMMKKFGDIGAKAEDVKNTFSCIKKENPKVLELGCANGRDAGEILKYTDDYLGLDYSEKFIKIAKENNPTGKFEIVDFVNYDFLEKIDIIFAFASLLHSDKNKVKSILDKAHTALNEKGIFYISLKYDKYHKEINTDEFGTRVYYFYTPEDMKELAGDKYKVLKEDEQVLRGQKWFTIILQKV